MRRVIAITLLCAVLSGCGASWSRTGDWNSNGDELFTPLFSGTCFDAAMFGWCLASPVIGWSDSFGIPPYAILCAPFPLIDMPFSFIADLCLIKRDLDLGREIRAREAARTEEDREAERQRDEAIRQEVLRQRERERLRREAAERHLQEQHQADR